MYMNIFRADPTNVGDAFCPPFIYFPFQDKKYIDILKIDQATTFKRNQMIIIGGGGLGTDFFRNKINILLDLKKKFQLKIIGWGLGYDIKNNKSHELISNTNNIISDIFDGFDFVGTRVYLKNITKESNLFYVPCSSCMHDAFFTFRKQQKNNKKIGVYSHKRVLLNSFFPDYDHLTNEGMDLLKVLNFISSYEFIVTNSYHGVFWATLLNKKVICAPFKSGLYSFKDKPYYINKYFIDDHILQSTKSFPYALEESRDYNFKFYKYIYEKFGGI